MQLRSDSTTSCASTSDHHVPWLLQVTHTPVLPTPTFIALTDKKPKCGVEQMLRSCAYVLFPPLFYLLSHCIVSHTTLDTGPYAALWSGNVFERTSVIFTEILTKLNAIMTKPFFHPAHKK